MKRMFGLSPETGCSLLCDRAVCSPENTPPATAPVVLMKSRGFTRILLLRQEGYATKALKESKTGSRRGKIMGYNPALTPAVAGFSLASRWEGVRTREHARLGACIAKRTGPCSPAKRFGEPRVFPRPSHATFPHLHRGSRACGTG